MSGHTMPWMLLTDGGMDGCLPALLLVFELLDIHVLALPGVLSVSGLSHGYTRLVFCRLFVYLPRRLGDVSEPPG
jgi:hypothetical protein